MTVDIIKKILVLAKNKPLTIISSGVVLFILLSCIACWYKYSHHLYNGIDLAIFTNLLTNLTTGNGWHSSIQGHSYLGDHFTPLLLLLAPIYYLLPHAGTLLVLQIIVLALTTYVIYAIARLYFPTNQSLPLLISGAWLINPLVWNIALFEFHIIPFALPLLFGTVYFYNKNNFKAFIALMLLALLVREDVSLIVIAWGALAWFDRKPLQYRLVPALLGSGYFVISLLYISNQSMDSWRFTTYYQWLGSTPLEILNTLLTQPLMVLGHIFTPGTLVMLIGLLLPVLFLPVFAKRWLILTLPSLSVFLLGAAGGSNIIVQTHYATLLLLGVICGSIAGLQAITTTPNHRWYTILHTDPLLTKIVVSTFLVLSWLSFSPLAKGILTHTTPSITTRTAQALAQQTAKEQPIMTSYRLLPMVANRPIVYSAHYAFLGVQQFSDQPYPLIPPAYEIIFDQNDLLTYWLQLYKKPSPAATYHDGIQRWQNILSEYTLTTFEHNIQYWTRALATTNPLNHELQPNTSTPLCEFGSTQSLLRCAAAEKSDVVYFIRVTDANGKVILLPFTWRLLLDNSTYAAKLSWYVPPEWVFPLFVETIHITGQTELGPWLDVVDIIYNIKPVAATTVTRE